jgi:proline dehydrogenase
MEQMMRDVLLYLSKSKTSTKMAKRYGLRFGASRFVAGETIDTAIAAIRELNRNGIVATLDHLGEFVANAEEAKASADYCVRTLNAIHESGVKSGLSVKLTQLGLDISKELCLGNMHSILDAARKNGQFVRIDMEDYTHNEITIDIFKQLIQKYGPKTVGLVIQAYLFKSNDDLDLMHQLGATLRIVKGAYKEPSTVAFPEKSDVDKNYLHLVEKHLQNGHYTAVATHDENCIAHVKAFVKEHQISKELFEFQMLYGIRTQLQLDLAKEGYKVRVYVPYGDDWYGYFMRRLAERPANVGFVLKSMFKA